MTHGTLLLPALRAEMGDWTYYIASITLEELAQRVTTATDLHQPKALDEEIQRSLEPRASDIAEYLRFQPQRLFGTLVIGVYEGAPEWLEVEIDERARPWPQDDQRLEGTIGLLRLSGAEQLFALDGQHRLLGTKQAIREDPSLGREEVAVIFVGHSTDQGGLVRTRRLFSTLNRYAKKVSKSDIIRLDEDDAVAIVTRRLLESHRLFAHRVALGKTKAVPTRDQRNVTSIIALYDSVELVLRVSAEWNSKHKRFRPADETLNVLASHCASYWDVVVEENEALQTYLQTSVSTNPAMPYRGTHGGHLFFRPVGILAHTWVATALYRKEELDFRTAVQRLAAVPMELSESPWAGLLWDAENHRMRTASEGQRVAKWIMYYLAGGTLERVGSSKPKLKAELAGLLNRDPDEVELPSGRGAARRVTGQSGSGDVT